MKRFLLCLILAVPTLAGDLPTPDNDRARKGGPKMADTKRQPQHSSLELLGHMFNQIDEHWFVKDYEAAQHVEFRARIDANLPASSLDSRVKSGDNVAFDLTVDGVSAPNGQYRMDMTGDLGEVAMVKDLKRNFISSPTFKSFADTPIRSRSENANLTNYRSYFLRYMSRMRNQILKSGHYRHIYVGTGLHEGRNVHIVRVYRPNLKKPTRQKAPMPIKKMWTFWHQGGYEIWIDQKTKLPAVVFYTNRDDNVYANFTIDYDDDLLPKRISYTNNSLKSEGTGDFIFTYDQQKMLSGVSLRFDGDKGMSLRLDATLAFGGALGADAFRVIPPFGFKKINRDHLKLMILTQISGGLLKLKKHGVNFKNFKF